MMTQQAILLSVRLSDSLARNESLLGQVLSMVQRDSTGSGAWTIVEQTVASLRRSAGAHPDAVLKMVSGIARVGLYHYARRERAWVAIIPCAGVELGELQRRIRAAVPRAGAGPEMSVDVASDLEVRDLAVLLRCLGADARVTGQDTAGQASRRRSERAPDEPAGGPGERDLKHDHSWKRNPGGQNQL
jgi:hypothetical protein